MKTNLPNLLYFNAQAPSIRQTLLIATFALLSTNAFSQQDKIKIKGIKVDNKINLNFDANGEKIKYLKLEDNTAAPRALDDKQTFTLTDNYSNLNFRWKNPLKYTFTWKDSTYADEQQAALKDFLKLLNPLFNIPTTTDDDASHTQKMVDAAKKGKITDKKKTLLINPEGGFKDFGLATLYVQLLSNQKKLTEKDRLAINQFTPKLSILEKGDKDYLPEVKKIFGELFDVKDPLDVTKKGKDGVADIAQDNVDGYNTALKLNTTKFDIAADAFKDVHLETEPYDQLFQSGIAEYFERSKKLNTTGILLVNKLSPLIETLKKSVTGDNVPFTYGQYNDMVLMRSVKLEDGKVLQTEVAINQYKIGDDGMTIEKEKEFNKVKMIFRSYEPITFSVSTGLFYGSTSIRGYGTATANNEMTVTEDTIKRNTAVTALFGNLSFGIGSRLLAPTIQLGVDPTKRHPFFLLGGGMAFPVASFAITAGGIWTFEPTLNKLKPGDKIASTTDLEKDIKNNFQLNPKGWYLGIQYNF